MTKAKSPLVEQLWLLPKLLPHCLTYKRSHLSSSHHVHLPLESPEEGPPKGEELVRATREGPSEGEELIRATGDGPPKERCTASMKVPNMAREGE